MDWHTLVVAHAVPTLFLTGLIWFVQVVHYPLYSELGGDRLVAYERAHCQRITPLVLPAMVAELALAAWLVAAAPGGATRAWALGGVGLLAIVWASTFLLQMPAHRVLEQRADAAAVLRLVATNWLRTVTWTLRAVVAVRLLLLELP